MEEACKRLWAAVLNQAIEEALKCKKKDLKKSALSWLRSKNQGIGSFLWICGVLNIDPTSVLIGRMGNADLNFERDKTINPTLDSCYS